MAQTKKKRRRKHRGTPAGTIERAGRTGQTRTREDAKKLAREDRVARIDREPTWRGSVNRAAIAALVFGALMILAFDYEPKKAAPLLLFMFLLYIPLGYATDRAIYNFRRRRQGPGPRP